MADRPAPDLRTGFLARLNMLETLVFAAICLVAIAGLMLVGKGFYIKAKSELPQMPLRRSFETQTYRETNVSPWRAKAAFVGDAGQHGALGNNGHVPVKSV
ncbi:hypothetical protein [Pararhizobium sp. LjRoot238]|uniref:hypothetical protein n=1 Tax=Pararhizobium sp. LjRoot238 TaxID=3342293 RepID=UPI003ED09ADE